MSKYKIYEVKVIDLILIAPAKNKMGALSAFKQMLSSQGMNPDWCKLKNIKVK